MLTDKALKALRPREKPYKRADEKGLYVIVQPDTLDADGNVSRRGGIWWRFKYRVDGREKTLSMGTYPDTSLKLAREQRDQARADLAAGVDPSAKRQAQKAARADTFETVARDWLKSLNVKQTTVDQLRHRLETYAFPYIGRAPIATVRAADVLGMVRRVESRGKHETAHRIRSLCSRVFRFAVASGIAERDPAADLKGALAAVKTSSFPAITDPKQIGALLRAIDGYHGQPTVTAALKLAPLLFTRPGELRAAEWAEFDVEGKTPEWRIPGERMKMGQALIVPLSTQAIAVLEELRPISGNGRLLFPSLRSSSRPISENTLNAALRTLGFSKDQMTAHGFRTMASTRLNELGFNPDAIERQLAHARAGVRGIYNAAEYLPERRRMMQSWADYLDGLKAGASVRAIRGRR